MNTQLTPASRATIKGLAGFLGAAIALHGTPAHAQQSELDLLRQQMTQMQARIDKLEAAKIDVKSVTPTVSSASKMPVVVSGLLQEQFNAFFSQKPPAAGGAVPDSFRLRRGEIKILAPQITSRLSGWVMFDPAKSQSGTPANGILQELAMTYNIDSNKNAPKFIDLGQYKIPVGYEGDQISSSALPLIERAQMYRYRDLGGGGFGDIRDQGARLRGTLANGTVDYTAGVFNGLGERQNQGAGGDPKAFIARLAYKPLNTGLQVGVSGAIANTRGVVAGPLDRNVYNGYAVYKKKQLSLAAEYSKGKSKNKTTPATFKNGEGYYASVGYLINPKFELVGRYDEFKTNLSGVSNKSEEISGGVNYYIKGNNAKLQTDLVKVNGGLNGPTSGPFNDGFDSLQLRTQFQVAF